MNVADKAHANTSRQQLMLHFGVVAGADEALVEALVGEGEALVVDS